MQSDGQDEGLEEGWKADGSGNGKENGKKGKGNSKQKDRTRMLFLDNGSTLRSARTAALVAIDPRENGGRKEAWLFVTGPVPGGRGLWFVELCCEVCFCIWVVIYSVAKKIMIEDGGKGGRGYRKGM